MTLPVPHLDDRTFQDIVDEAKRKIPELLPQWTNHNVSDPGVALIELFAWMTDLTLFRLNQVPDAFFTHMLNLMGYNPIVAKAATADLTFWLSAPCTTEVRVNRGASVATSGVVGEPRVFATVDDLIIRPPALTMAMTSSDDKTTEEVWKDALSQVNNTTPVKVFPQYDKPHPGDCFYLGFDASLARLAVELTVSGPIQGRGIDPTKPPLVWEASVEGDFVECTVVPGTDTTGGLNRQGRLVILMPSKHEPINLDGKSMFWLRARLVPAAAGQKEYESSPQILTIAAATVGGTITAEHSETMGREIVGISIGRPGQIFRVARAPILSLLPDEKVLVISDTGEEEWEVVADFIDSGEDDPHVKWDISTGEIRFGPKIRQPDVSKAHPGGRYVQHGAIPAEGARIVVTGYRHGGGGSGNVGAGKITAWRNPTTDVSHVENLFASTGGVEAETIEEAKVRGPQTLRAGERAVTAADFERLVKQSGQPIARVRCLPPRLPDDPTAPTLTSGADETPADGIIDTRRRAPKEVPGLVRLLLVPEVKTAPGEAQRHDEFKLTAKMVAELRRYLGQRRILGTSIELRPPYYQGVSVAALITPIKGRAAALVQGRALEALYQALSPVGTTPDGGWPWETDLTSAAVYQILEGVDGVDRVNDVVLFEYDLRNDQRVGLGRDVIKLESHSLFLSAKHRVIVQ